MLMENHTARLVEHLPSPLPCQVAKVRVFEIKRREKMVEAAELQKLLSVERAGAATAVEAGK
jgi:hypothetical protein